MVKTLDRMIVGMVCFSLFACASDSGNDTTTQDAAIVMDGGTLGAHVDMGDARAIDAPVATNGVDAGNDSSDLTSRPDAAPNVPGKAYGEQCSADSQCESKFCLTNDGCSRSCDIKMPNPCRAEKAFCVPLQGDPGFACAEMIDTGSDTDDAYISVGDRLTRSLTPLKDADMFTVEVARSEPVSVIVTPSAGIDVALDAYNPIAQPIGAFNSGGPGGIEAGLFSAGQTDSWVFVIVRNVGNSTGQYQISVEKQK